MPYIYVASRKDETWCTCIEEKISNPKPVSKWTSTHPFGSIWECPTCGRQFEKRHDPGSQNEKSGFWRELEPEEYLVFNEETGQYTKPEDL